MSLYGNVRRIGSQQFQFDRIYPSRYAMDEANREKSDGVHIGRYILIEYGQRYDSERNEQGEVIYTYRNEFDAATNEMKQIPYPKQIEREEYTAAREVDTEKYGMNYDSTVWQKIFSNGVEKYIMIAELNAILPKLNMSVEGSLIYSVAENEEDADEVYDAFNNKIEGINVEINKPYFDQYQDTEISYLLHFPQPIQLNVDSDSIDYNEAGFNIFYDTPKDPSPSYIHWTTDDFYGKNYNADGQESSSDIVYPKTELTALLNSRTLRMHIPAFGNAISDLYDMLYGHASYERDENNNIIYLPNREPQIAFYRSPKGLFLDVHGHYLTTITVNGVSTERVIVNEDGQPIDEDGNVIEKNDQGQFLSPLRTCSGELVLDSLRPYFKQYRDKYPYIMDTSTLPPQPTDIQRNPLNDTMDDMYWKKDVPGIDKILSNNSAGLAALLAELFGVKNPLTGEIKYWLLNDWTSEEYNEEGNTPTLRNKPEVVTYSTMTEYQDLESIFAEKEASQANNQYANNRKKWLTGVKVTAADTNIPIINNDQEEVRKEPVGYIQDYSYYLVKSPESDNPVFEDGHWYVDISSWALRKVPSILPNGLEEKTFKIFASNILQIPNNNIATANQGKVSISKTNDDIVIVGDLDQLGTYNKNGNLKKWIAVDIKTNVKDVSTLTVDGQPLTQEDLQEIEAAGLKKGHFLYYVDAEAINNNPLSITVTRQDGTGLTITFSFIETIKVIVDKLFTAPSDNSQFNQDNIVVQRNNNSINIIGALDSLRTFNIDNEEKKWIGLDIEANTLSIVNLTLNGNRLTDDDVANASSVGLDENHILYWVSAEDIYTTPETITIAKDGAGEISLTFNFVNNFVVTADKLVSAPDDENRIESQANQDAITITQSNNNIEIRGDLDSLNAYYSTDPNQNSEPKKWIGIDLATNINDITNIYWGQYQLTANDVADSTGLGLPAGHIIFWTDAEALSENPITISLRNHNQIINLNFSFINTNE